MHGPWICVVGTGGGGSYRKRGYEFGESYGGSFLWADDGHGREP
jgi:hypothetical protein